MRTQRRQRRTCPTIRLSFFTLISKVVFSLPDKGQRSKRDLESHRPYKWFELSKSTTSDKSLQPLCIKIQHENSSNRLLSKDAPKEHQHSPQQRAPMRGVMEHQFWSHSFRGGVTLSLSLFLSLSPPLGERRARLFSATPSILKLCVRASWGRIFWVCLRAYLVGRLSGDSLFPLYVHAGPFTKRSL